MKPNDLRPLELKIHNQLKAPLQNTTAITQGAKKRTDRDVDSVFMLKLKTLISNNLSNPDFGVNDMAFQMGASVSVLYRRLRPLTGMTVNDFVKTLRMKSALQLLETGTMNVNEVATAVGYSDTKYFSRDLKRCTTKTLPKLENRL